MSKQTDLINVTDAITVSGSNVGIGTSSPSQKLSVEVEDWGGIDIKQTTTNKDPILSLTGPDAHYWAMQLDSSGSNSLEWRYDNTARMNIDASGRVTTPYQPMCDVKLNGNTSTSGAIFTTNNVVTNNGGHWDSTNHRFVAPVTGSYLITLSAYTNYSSSYGYYAIYKNGANTQTMHWNHAGMNGHTTMGYTRIFQLSANDYIDARRPGAGSSFFDVTFITVQLVG